jgi:hypothetical protein
MTDQQITEKDLDLVDESADDAGDKGADGGAKDQPTGDQGKDEGKQSGKQDAPKSGSLLDDLDADDDAEGKDEGKQKGKPEGDKPAGEKDDAKGADDKAADDKKADDDKPAEDWRIKAIEKILAPVKDKLTAAKFEKRREQLTKQLGRYKTEIDAIASGVLAQEKLRSGNKLDETATPEAQAQWRKEQGMPEAAEKYDIPNVAGHTWTEKDQPVIDGFKSLAFKHNLPQAAVNELVDWHVKENQRLAEEWDAEQKRADATDREECLDQLRTEFGVRELKPNLKLMERLIHDEEVFGGETNARAIMSARYLDEETGQWRRLTSIPGVARGLIGQALDRYGDGALPSGDGRPSAQQDELDKINEIMNTDYDRYIREGLADKAMKIMREREEKANKRAARR